MRANHLGRISSHKYIITIKKKAMRRDSLPRHRLLKYRQGCDDLLAHEAQTVAEGIGMGIKTLGGEYGISTGCGYAEVIGHPVLQTDFHDTVGLCLGAAAVNQQLGG